MKTKLLHQLEEHGYQGRIVASQRVHDLQEEIETRRKEALTETFFRKWLTRFVFDPSDW